MNRFFKFSLCKYKVHSCFAFYALWVRSAKQAAIALTAAVMVSSMSCKDKPEVQPEPTLSVTPSVTDIVFSADGRTATVNGTDFTPLFKVETNQSLWDVSAGNCTWLTITRLPGSQFSVTAKNNTALTSPAPAEITVTAGDAKSVKIRVQQLSAAYSLIVMPEHRKILFSFDGKLATTQDYRPVSPVFSVATNVSQWDAISDQSWLTVVNDKEKNTITLTAVENTGADPFDEAKVTVTAGAAEAVTITVNNFPPRKKIDRIPVLAWGGVPEYLANASQFAILVEAGYTHVMEHVNPPNLERYLNLAQQAGLKVILAPQGTHGVQPNVLEPFLNEVRKYMNHPAVGGYYIIDEPWGKDFNYVSTGAKDT